MLIFSTKLNINETLTKEEFIQLVIDWNKNTPHPENAIQNIEWDGSHNVRFGTDDRWLEIQEYRNANTIAVRYEKVDSDGVIWDSDFVMNFEKYEMVIQLDRSFLADAPMRDFRFQPPYFITSLLDKGYIKDDGVLPMLKTPFYITPTNIEILASIVNGTCNFDYPVIYVSKNRDGSEPINVGKLASELKGIAHVLVQKELETNSKIRDMCDGKNEYHGAIGMYFPRGVRSHQKYISRVAVGFDDSLFERIKKIVLQYSNSQNVEELLTWMGVNNALIKDKLFSREDKLLDVEYEKIVTEFERDKAEQEKEKAIRAKEEAERQKLESDDLVASIDEEIVDFKRQIQNLTLDNERLRAENKGLRDKINSLDNEPILFFGTEEDFFPGEIKDFVLDSLFEAVKNMKTDRRRATVINDIIASNDYKHLHEKRAEELKAKLKGYKCMDGNLRRYLNSIGFSIKEEGKHYQLCYFDDSRYKTTVSKTASDYREGQNIATQIIRDVH